MVNVNLKLQNLAAIESDLQKLALRNREAPRRIARDVGLLIQGEVDSIFASTPRGKSGGSVYGGETWKALSDAYLKSRPERAGGQILRDTGALLNSLQVGGSGNVFEQSSDRIFFGTSLPKASRLNSDRPFLFVTAAMATAITRIYERYLLEDR